MLCKIISTVSIVNDSNYEKSSNATRSAPYTTIDTYYMPATWKLFIDTSIKCANTNGAWLYRYIDNVAAQGQYHTGTLAYTTSTTYTKVTDTTQDVYQTWQRIDLRTQSYNSSATITIKWLNMYVIPENYTTNYDYIIYPKDLKSLWELCIGTIYWIHNNEFKGGIIRSTTNSITTWAISPWNFVWYLEVNYNWNIVKIPYYN